jgi:hypothetical protein
VGITELMKQKGADITEELARQDRQLSSATNNLFHVEHVSDQMHRKLRGMSFGGKVFNLLNRTPGKPEVQIRINDASWKGNSGFKDMSALIRQPTTPSLHIKSPEDSKQQQIKNGIDDLHAAMDVITGQQMDIAETLLSQDGRLALFEDTLDNTNSKINCSSEVINHILKANK